MTDSGECKDCPDHSGVCVRLEHVEANQSEMREDIRWAIRLLIANLLGLALNIWDKLSTTTKP